MQRRRVLAAGAALCTMPVSWPLRAENGFDVQPWPANKAAPKELSSNELRNQGSPRFQCNNWRYAKLALTMVWCGPIVDFIGFSVYFQK